MPTVIDEAAHNYKRATVVAICFCVATLEGYDVQAFGVAAPLIARSLHLSMPQIGYAGAALALGIAIGAAIGGIAADRVGFKAVLVTSVVWFGLCSVVNGMVANDNSLTVARFATGLGVGAAMPNLVAIAIEIALPERRASVVTAMFVGFPTGAAVAALATRWLLHGEAWRLVFTIGGVLQLIISPLILFLLPPVHVRTARETRRGWLVALFGRGLAIPTMLIWVAIFLSLFILYLMLNWLPSLVVAKGLPPGTGALASFWFNLVGVSGGWRWVQLSIAADFVGRWLQHTWPLRRSWRSLLTPTDLRKSLC